MYSRLDIRYYNHLMHKLESLSRGVACMPERRATWTQVLRLTERTHLNPDSEHVAICIIRRRPLSAAVDRLCLPPSTACLICSHQAR